MQFIHLARLSDLHTRKPIFVKTGSYPMLISLAEEQAQYFDPTDTGIEQTVRATLLPDEQPHDNSLLTL